MLCALAVLAAIRCGYWAISSALIPANLIRCKILNIRSVMRPSLASFHTSHKSAVWRVRIVSVENGDRVYSQKSDGSFHIYDGELDPDGLTAWDTLTLWFGYREYTTTHSQNVGRDLSSVHYSPIRISHKDSRDTHSYITPKISGQ